MHTKEMIYITSYLDGQEVYLLDFRYDEAINTLLKQALNHLRPTYVSRTGRNASQAGGWKPEVGRWYVAEVIWAEFTTSLKGFGYRFVYEDSGNGKRNYHEYNSRPNDPITPNLFRDWLNLDASNKQLLRNTYRDLARLLHPDRQSDQHLQQLATQLMARINSDFDNFGGRR